MGNKKAKWTFIDTIIAIVIAAALAAAGVKLGTSWSDKAEKGKVRFTAMLQTREQELYDAMTVGDNVTLSLMEKDGGVITDLRSEPASQLSFNSMEGEYINELIEDRIDIYVTIEADCEITDEYIKTGDTLLNVGINIPIRGKGFTTSGYVITIDEL